VTDVKYVKFKGKCIIRDQSSHDGKIATIKSYLESDTFKIYSLELNDGTDWILLENEFEPLLKLV
jgi:hypothetical protein